jgi:hypothetical protein
LATSGCLGWLFWHYMREYSTLCHHTVSLYFLFLCTTTEWDCTCSGGAATRFPPSLIVTDASSSPPPAQRYTKSRGSAAYLSLRSHVSCDKIWRMVFRLLAYCWCCAPFGQRAVCWECLAPRCGVLQCVGAAQLTMARTPPATRTTGQASRVTYSPLFLSKQHTHPLCVHV